jgi:hypothetical protein
MSVSFTTAASTASASLSSTAGGARDVSLASGGNTLVITRAQLVLARIELQRAGATCSSSAASGDDDADEHECAELQLAPTLVDLPVDASVVSALNVTVPAGSYSSLEAKVRPVGSSGGSSSGSGSGRGTSAFLAAHPELAGVSVRVEGTYNGKAFVYTGAPETGIETSFTPALAVDASPVNLTVHVDLSTWFRTQSGALIDPTTAVPGGANAALVSDNIRRSFRAFHDDDRNGHDDDGVNHS